MKKEVNKSEGNAAPRSNPFEIKRKILNKFMGNWSPAYSILLNYEVPSHPDQQDLISPFSDSGEECMRYQNVRGVFMCIESGKRGDFFDFAGLVLGFDTRSNEFKDMMYQLDEVLKL